MIQKRCTSTDSRFGAMAAAQPPAMPNARHLLEALVVGMPAQHLGGGLLDGIALLDEVSHLGNDEAEHGDGRGIGSDGQGDRGLGGFVDVAEQAAQAVPRAGCAFRRQPWR